MKQQDYPLVMTAEQLADLLHLHVDYVPQLTRKGILPASRLPGGRVYRYLRDDILHWLREQQSPTHHRLRESHSAQDHSR